MRQDLLNGIKLDTQLRPRAISRSRRDATVAVAKTTSTAARGTWKAPIEATAAPAPMKSSADNGCEAGPEASGRQTHWMPKAKATSISAPPKMVKTAAQWPSWMRPDAVRSARRRFAATAF